MTNDDPSQSQPAKQIVRQLYDEVWSHGDFTHVQDYLAPQVSFHFRGNTFTHTPADLIRIVTRWRAAFPDLRFDVDAIIAEQDLVAVRLTRRGTQHRVWRGIAPTGRQMVVEEVVFLRFEDGRIAEVWEVTDEYAEHQQLLGHGM